MLMLKDYWDRNKKDKGLRYIWIFVSDICKDIGIKTNE